MSVDLEYSVSEILNQMSEGSLGHQLGRCRREGSLGHQLGRFRRAGRSAVSSGVFDRGSKSTKILSQMSEAPKNGPTKYSNQRLIMKDG